MVPASAQCTRIALRRRDPRHRPGHDGHDLPRLRRRGGADRTRLPRVRAALPAAGMGRARRGGDLGRVAGGGRGGTGRRRASARASCARSASRTSARRCARGIPRPASRCTARSSGRTGGPRRAATSCGRPATSRWCASARASSSTRTSRARRSNGCWSTSRACASARSRSRRVRHGRLVAAVQPHRRARHRPVERLPDPALRHRARGAGTPTCAACSACPSARCPRCGRAAVRWGRCAGECCPVTTACPWRAWPATSRRRCSARPASTPGWARTPTGPARSSCSTRAPTPPPPASGLLATVAWGVGEQAHLRPRGGDLRHGRRGAVAARRPGDDRAGRRDATRWRRRSRATKGSTSSPRSPAWARRTGTPTPAGRSSG